MAREARTFTGSCRNEVSNPDDQYCSRHLAEARARPIKEWRAETSFTVTEQHLALLPRLWFNHNSQVEFLAPAVNPKRPYGNSDVHGDMCDILGLEGRDEDGDLPEGLIPMLDWLHFEMHRVLEIVCRHGAAVTGTFERCEYGSDWLLIEDGV